MSPAMPSKTVIALLAASVASAVPIAAQTDDGTTFRWSGSIAAGNAIRVHNLNGDIRVERGEAGSQVEIVAERRVRRGDPKVVRFDVVVCALWGTDMQCTDDGGRGSYRAGNWARGNEIDVLMRVRVPDGVRTVARSTNGSISAQGLASEVDAATTNGNVNIRTTGEVVNATTTNGSITASLGRLRGDQPMRFTSTNGSVTVYAPASLSADLEMSTVNGALSSDFPLTMTGSFRRNSIKASLGQGGRALIVRTTNGDVALKRNGI
jgi:hypothetical protein